MKISKVPLKAVPAEVVAAWLELVLGERGWSMHEVARRMGCRPSTVLNWRKRGAPAHVGLAMHALSRGMGPWKAPKEV